MRLQPTLFVLAAAITLPLPALASETDLTIADAYVRMVPPGTPNTAAFMTIVNNGTSDRKLIKAESPLARRGELHTHLNDQGMMRMRQVAEIEIKAATQTELKPGGYHVMLMDLKEQVKEGATVPVTLVIEGKDKKRSTVEVKASIKPLTTAAPAKMDHQHKH